MNGSLTKSEIGTLLKGLTRTMPGGVYSKEDFEAVMSWATDARLNAQLLDMVLQGYIDVSVEPEGVLGFIATVEGLESVKRPQLERIVQ